MITTADIAPFAGTVGGGFLTGFIAGWSTKKVIRLAVIIIGLFITALAYLEYHIRLAVIIIGLFITALAYLEYHRIVNVDWDRIQIASQNGFTWVANAITHISSTFGAPHVGVSNVGIPLLTSASAGFALGMVRG